MPFRRNRLRDVRVVSRIPLSLRGKAPVVDGVRLNYGDRILLAGEKDKRLNGISVYVGDMLIRVAENLHDAIVKVGEGATYAEMQFIQTTKNPIYNFSAIEWSQVLLAEPRAVYYHNGQFLDSEGQIVSSGLTISDNKITKVPSVPVVQLRAMIKLLFPEEITPVAKQLLEKICDEHNE